MSITYGGSDVSEVLRFTVFFIVSLKLITHIHFDAGLLR